MTNDIDQICEYIQKISATQEFIYARKNSSLGFDESDVECALEKMLSDNGLLERVLADLPNPIDYRIFGDTLMTWRKGYTVEHTADVLKTNPAVIERIRNEFQMRPRLGFDSKIDVCGNLKRDLANMRRRELPKKQLHVMMGTTPSGPLHLANIFTLAGATLDVLTAITDAEITDARFTLGFNDFFALHNGHSEEDIEKRKDGVKYFIDEMQRVYGVEITLQPFSKLQRTPAFRQTLQKAASNGLFYVYGGNGKIVLNSSPCELGQFNYDYRRNFNTYDFLNNTDEDFVPTSLLDLMALRDAAEEVDVHILGGDQTHAGKITSPQRFVGNQPPFMYITGTVYGLNGREMHASDRNTITIDELRTFPDWLKKVVEIKEQAQYALTRDVVGPLEYRCLIPQGRIVYGLEHSVC